MYDSSDETPKTIGYAGCSNTTQAVEGYWQVGGEKMWPPDEGFDNGSVMNWSNSQSRWWRAFDRNVEKYPDTNIVWWQLCVPEEEAGFITLEDVDSITDSFKARFPNAIIYVSSLAPYQHFCEATGRDGVSRGQKLAEELAAQRDDVELGPNFSILTLSDTISDKCHLNDTGMQKTGGHLKEVFEKVRN